jgi:Uncharacterised protein family (UPF0158)
MVVPMKVYLQEVVDEMIAQTDECRAYLNCKTGELYTITLDTLTVLEGEDDLDSLADWQRDEVAKATEILDSEEWRRLPTKFDIHEYQIMEEFCRDFKNSFVQGQLLNGIRGSGAFRRFKAIAHQYGIEDEWYKYRDEAYEKIAIEWLEEQGIAYKRGRRPSVYE